VVTDIGGGFVMDDYVMGKGFTGLMLVSKTSEGLV